VASTSPAGSRTPTARPAESPRAARPVEPKEVRKGTPASAHGVGVSLNRRGEDAGKGALRMLATDIKMIRNAVVELVRRARRRPHSSS
jgi:hypothetical protein